MSKPSGSPFGHQPIPPQPVPHQTVIVQQPALSPPSQALPGLASFFVIGLGQLIQGRVGAALFWFLAALVSTVLCFVAIGFVLLPLVWILCIVDAAKYNPVAYRHRRGFSLLRVALGVIIVLAAFFGLGKLLDLSEPGRSTTRGTQPTESTLIPYTIINREEFQHYKVSYVIMVDVVDGRLPAEDELAAISNHLRSEERKYDRMFVSFYLPGMQVGAGSFASAHHKPTPEPVRMNWFLLPAKYEKFAQSADEALVDTDKAFPDELLGTWETADGKRMIIRKNEITHVLPTSTFSTLVGRVESIDGGYRVVVVEHGKEHPQTWQVTEDQFSITYPRGVAALYGSPYKRVNTPE